MNTNTMTGTNTMMGANTMTGTNTPMTGTNTPMSTNAPTTNVVNTMVNKHNRYALSYIANDTFWGVGIENETYLECSEKKEVNKQFMLQNHKRDSKCLDYYFNYKKDVFNKCINKLFTDNDIIKLPILMNAHSFLSHTIDGTKICYDTYKKNETEYPQSLLIFLQEKNKYFLEEYGKKFVFDGDTIEFMTQKFYKAKIKDVVDELLYIKKEFITNVKNVFSEYNILKKYGDINICKQNHGFATFLTNINNLGIFNNMTYHFNFTLPTKLNEQALVENENDFEYRHIKAIRILQYLTPLLLTRYGSPDILSYANCCKVSPSSQRCALSRYIGIGSYDTNLPKEQRISNLTRIPKENKPTYWWYYLYKSDYVLSDMIGLDFNFNKYGNKNHGIEFRIFDYFDENLLCELLEFFVYLFDHTYANEIDNPIYNETWNNLTLKIISEKEYVLSSAEIDMYNKLLNINIKNDYVVVCLQEIMGKMKDKYKLTGVYSKDMI